MDSLRVIYAIWYRETVRFMREKARLMGMIIMPLLYLFVVGSGITHAMTFRAAPEGSDISYIVFMYPGIIGMSVLFTSVFSAISIIWDREFGFLKEVLVAPVSRWAVALGKVVGIVTVVLIQTAILLLLAPLMDISLSLLSIAGVLLTCALLAAALGSLGIAVASRMESMEGFQMIMNLMIMPMFFLSGAIFPLHNMPGWLSFLMHINPLTYGVDAMRSIIYADLPGAQFLVQFNLALDLAVVGGLAVVLLFIGSYAFSRQ